MNCFLYFRKGILAEINVTLQEQQQQKRKQESLTAIERTAYPRFKRVLTAKDLVEVYTPTPQERFLAHRSTKGTVAELGFLVLLKTYQRLGYFISLGDVPSSIRVSAKWGGERI